MKEQKNKTNVVFNVPNDEEGQYFLHLANKYLNKDTYSIWKRGRRPSISKIMRDLGCSKTKAQKVKRYANNTGSIPLTYADYFGIYLRVDGEFGKETLNVNDRNWYRTAYLNQLTKNAELAEELGNLKDAIKTIRNVF